MLIVASLTQPGGRERVTRMNKQLNAHRRKPNSTRGGGGGERVARMNKERMYIITSLAQPAGRERVKE